MTSCYPIKRIIENPPPPNDDYDYEAAPRLYTFCRPQLIYAPYYFQIDEARVHKDFLLSSDDENKSEEVNENQHVTEYHLNNLSVIEHQTIVENEPGKESVVGEQPTDKNEPSIEKHLVDGSQADIKNQLAGENQLSVKDTGIDEKDGIEDGELIDDENAKLDELKSIYKKRHRPRKKKKREENRDDSKSEKSFKTGYVSPKDKHKERRSHHGRSYKERDQHSAESEEDSLKSRITSIKTSSKELLSDEERPSRRSKHPMREDLHLTTQKSSSRKSKCLREDFDSDSDQSNSRRLKRSKTYSDLDDEKRHRMPKSSTNFEAQRSQSRSVNDITDSDEDLWYTQKSKASQKEIVLDEQSHSKGCKISVKKEKISDDENIDSGRFKIVDISNEISPVKLSRVKQEALSEVDTYVKKLKKPLKNTSADGDQEKIVQVEDRSSSNSSSVAEVKQDIKTEIKIEPATEGPGYLGPGAFYCSICKLSLNSECTWNSHLHGKRHLKAIKAMHPQQVAKSSLSLGNPNLIPVASIPEGTPRYNNPPPGYERIELNKISSIQKLCDDVREPILCLDQVLEIITPNETVFYCCLCDAPCAASSVMPHLTGYKHQLSCLKELFPQMYDKLANSPKRKVETTIRSYFQNHQRRHGRGRIRVFEEIRQDAFVDSIYSQPGPSWRSAPMPRLKPDEKSYQIVEGETVNPSNDEYLDTSTADFRCIVCDAHMNNIGMWESHVRGKRHLKNLKKNSTGTESTSKFVRAPPGTMSHLERQIREECPNETIIGLNYIRENQGENGDQYNCFPCGGCCSNVDIIQHILSEKHKIKILEKLQAEGYDNDIYTINELQMNTQFRTPLVNSECHNVLTAYGPGKPQVYVSKKILL